MYLFISVCSYQVTVLLKTAFVDSNTTTVWKTSGLCIPASLHQQKLARHMIIPHILKKVPFPPAAYSMFFRAQYKQTQDI